MESTNPLTEIDVQVLQDLHKRFGPQIVGFIEMVKTLFFEKNIEGISLMLRLITASLETFAHEQQKNNAEWFSEHIKGNC